MKIYESRYIKGRIPISVAVVFMLILSGIVITSPYIDYAKGDGSADVPTVNGLFYGDGDYNKYYYLSEDPGRGTLYYYLDNDILYIAVVVNASVNDNVFGDKGNTSDITYLQRAGWHTASNGYKGHTAKELIGSDHLEFKLTIGNESWKWKQDYVYDLDNDKNPYESDWVSDPWDHDGGGTPPPGFIKSASSLQWNFNNGTWDVTMGEPDRNDSKHGKWKCEKLKSPVDSHNNATYVGWPTWDAIHQWEWAMVYEMSIDVSGYSGMPFTFKVFSAHNSPPKDGDDNITIPPIELIDYGDAPDSYSTLNISNGACHYIVINNPHLGASVDAEKDGQPNLDATGDDLLDGTDDEDGVIFTTPLIKGEQANVSINASTNGILNAWIDFNGDGDWDDVDEHVFTDVSLTGGENNLSFIVPSWASTGTTFARFRFSSVGGLSYNGSAPDGEVEDYKVEILSFGSIGDFVWCDANKDGIQDVNENGISGVTVHLLNSSFAIIDTTVTNDSGYYVFDNLIPDDYYVEFVLPSGYAFSLQDQGGDDTVDSDANSSTGITEKITISSGKHDMTWDTGMFYSLPPDIEVEKKVWDNVTWSNSTKANINDTVRFNISIHNNGNESLININVTDYLPHCLRYYGNATYTPIEWGNNLTWLFYCGGCDGCDGLPPGEYMYIEFDAIVVPEPDLPTDTVTMKVYDGNDSYFDTWLFDVPPGYDVTNGSYIGWCVDRSHGIKRNHFYQTTLYSTYDPYLDTKCEAAEGIDWDRINYVLNHEQGDDDDVQDAIWYFTGDKSYWQITPIARIMVNDALANGEGFVPLPGEIMALICYVNDNIQLTIIEINVTPNDGINVNTANASAIGIYSGETVYDEDSAIVDKRLANITIEKWVSEDNSTWFNHVIVDPGDLVYWNITVENTGDDPLTNVYVNDTNGKSFGPFNLAVNESISFYYETNPVKDVNNTATAEGKDSDGDKVGPVDDWATVDVINPDIEIEKWVAEINGTWFNHVIVDPGQIVYWNITVKNNGDDPLTNVYVNDTNGKSFGPFNLA
ncbi:MAG TPA: hypothetical protein ENI33_02015, partial [Thermoplasmatales archaeon]|nr:hypothetical protein [Thermoplasmatales archaeon]